MKRRIETKSSRTAEMTCLSRAASYYEELPQYKCNDNIAAILVPKFIKPLLKINVFRSLYKNKLAPKGIYEYVIARTKYIDEVFTRAIEKGFDQILVFGAGFDSRAIRLTKDEKRTMVFELDAYNTQKSKIQQLKKRGIAIPESVVFIPIDFNRESVRDKLAAEGFKKNKTTLFVMEGLLMYLDKVAIADTFNLINEHAGAGSEIVFDYIYSSVIRGENLFYGGKEAYEMVKQAQEQWTFGIKKGEITSFLNTYQIKLKEHLDSEELEQRYFMDENGKRMGRVNGAHCLVLAIK